MNTTIILHTEKEDSLRIILSGLVSKYDKTQVSLRLNCKSYIPWEKEDIKNVIITFGQYIANPTNLNQIESTIQLIYASTTERIVIVDEDNTESISISFNRRELLFLNLDRKYHSLSWFLKDIYKQCNIDEKYFIDNSDDCNRFIKKIESALYKEKIIYIDGGLGDHVMALPFLEKNSSDSFICCKYPFIFEHINKKGYIHWNDELFGGQNFSVYHYSSYVNYSKTIVDAFFEMHGFERGDTDILQYIGKRDVNHEYKDIEMIALICTSAAKVKGLDSNKDWPEIRWMKIVNEMKLLGYHVIQVGTETDNQIPNVDSKFLDKPLEKLASLIEQAKIWISVDTFFHHFAASINPTVGICLTPFYNDHAKHPGVKYIEKDCGKDFSSRKFWLDLQQPERKECMLLITVDDVLNEINLKSYFLKNFMSYVY